MLNGKQNQRRVAMNGSTKEMVFENEIEKENYFIKGVSI